MSTVVKYIYMTVCSHMEVRQSYNIQVTTTDEVLPIEGIYTMPVYVTQHDNLLHFCIFLRSLITTALFELRKSLLNGFFPKRICTKCKLSLFPFHTQNYTFAVSCICRGSGDNGKQRK